MILQVPKEDLVLRGLSQQVFLGRIEDLTNYRLFLLSLQVLQEFPRFLILLLSPSHQQLLYLPHILRIIPTDLSLELLLSIFPIVQHFVSVVIEIEPEIRVLITIVVLKSSSNVSLLLMLLV